MVVLTRRFGLHALQAVSCQHEQNNFSLTRMLTTAGWGGFSSPSDMIRAGAGVGGLEKRVGQAIDLVEESNLSFPKVGNDVLLVCWSWITGIEKE